MVKHRRWSDKTNNDSSEEIEKSSVEEILSEKPTRNFRSIVSSSIKYVYIICAAALLSGIFTPLTINQDWDTVIFGILAVLLGLAGGISIFIGISNQKFSNILILAGLGGMLACLIIMYELVTRSLFA
tara:strand:- start:153 stop:536 length:384 start_codon:yes stop_codon:yes gene_type:complete